MTIPLVPSADGGPLLTYGLQVDPDPSRVGVRNELTLVVSNASGDAIDCQSIQLALPVGTDATDLTDDSTTIEAAPASGWTVQKDGGAVTFTAPGGGVTVGGQGLLFTISVKLNAEPGTASLILTETASDGGGAQQTGSGTFAVDKFPADFSLSDLTTVPPEQPDVAYNEPARLNWTATGAGVSCILEYQPHDGGTPVNVNVPNSAPNGAYTTEPLTRDQSVTFTLTAQVSVLGRDNPMIRQRQLMVTIESFALTVTALPPRVGVNGLVLLQWHARSADHCLFEDGTVLETSGTRYVVLTQTHIFTITAIAADGSSLERQQTVTVDPSIVATETGYSAIGAAGADGTPGSYTPAKYQLSGNGGNGIDGDLTVSLPPLATSGLAARVIPIIVAGGAGGKGGIGDPGDGWPLPSGNGGNGGNASLAATFDATQSPPAQFIITVTAGAAGAGGSTTPQGVSGNPGSILSATIDGQPLHLP